MTVTSEEATMPVGRLQCVAIDAPDPRGLAEFYGSILGWRVREEDSTATWITLAHPDGGEPLCFQYAEEYAPPVWPGAQRPQQAHLDLEVDDLDAAESEVLRIGARKHEHQPGESFRVFLDPVGHPFCLVAA